MTLGCEKRALDALNSSKQWMTWMTLGYDLSIIDALKSSGLWMP